MHALFSTAMSIVNTEAKQLLNRSAIPAGVSALTLEGFCDWSAEESGTVAVTEVTSICVQPLYFINHTPTVLYNQKYKEYEITKNVEISTK